MQPRRVQFVSTKSQRKALLQWMIAKVQEDGTDNRITAETVNQFPNLFKQTNRRANKEKARQCWSTRNEFLSAIRTTRNKPLSTTTTPQRGCAVRRASVKALHGKGPKRQWWKNILHQVLKYEFSWLRTVGVKINSEFLRQLAISLVRNDETVPVSEQEVIESSRKELSDAISLDFVFDFCHRYNITTRLRTGNKSLSPEQVERKNKYLTYLLGILNLSYENVLDESTIENFDEAHVAVDMDNGRVLDFQGSKRVTYLDVASGRDYFRVCMRISGSE